MSYFSLKVALTSVRAHPGPVVIKSVGLIIVETRKGFLPESSGGPECAARFSKPLSYL